MAGVVRRTWLGLAAAALVAVALPGCTSSSTSKSGTGPLTLTPCVTAGVSARCGTLRVSGDQARVGPTIAVRVIVIPAAGTSRQPDPIVWFAGGPGDSAVDMIGRVRPLFGSVTDRDLVFIEQRGTGASNVTCPALPGLDDEAALHAAVTSCLHGLRVDLRNYSTAAFTDDVDQVLTALRYRTVDLVGISYGTTAEQVFLARHPARVRTMTLLSGTLLTVPVFERMPAAAQRALDGVFAECAADPACHGVFPDLSAEWAALWMSVSQQPWVVPADRSPSGERLVLDADWVAGRVHELLLTADTQADLPLVVHTLATATDRVAALLALTAAMPPSADTTGGRTQLLPLAVQCNEQWARRDPARLAGAGGFEYRTDLAQARWWQYVCGLVPHTRTPGGAGQPTNSTVAVLALNGTLDPQDPPANMAAAGSLWPNGVYLPVPGQGHDIDNRSGACEAQIIRAFIDRGTPDGLDTSCLHQLPSPTFPLTLQPLGGN